MHETPIFSEGHKDVTWVLVRKVFLHGSRFKEDPNTALDQPVSVQVMTEIIGFRLQEQTHVTELCTYTDFNSPVIIQRLIDKLSVSVIVDSVPLL